MPLLKHVGLFLFILPLALFAQSNQNGFRLVPEKDFFYLDQWNLTGNIKSISIKTYNPRNATSRFVNFDECRMTAKASEQFSTKEETFLFNKKGQLVKRVEQTPNGNINTLFAYNFFEKISEIETLDRLIRFTYDFDGRLTLIERMQGAKKDWENVVQYHGDSIISVSRILETTSVDSMIEILDKSGNLIKRSIKLPTHEWKNEEFEYDTLGRVLRQWNNLDMFLEYEYDERNRVTNTYIHRDKSFLGTTEYDDHTGIRTTTRKEWINGCYLARNQECLCMVIDGHNNPIKVEAIDCQNVGEENLFGLKHFVEITYSYFK
jgi:hypothetical protein